MDRTRISRSDLAKKFGCSPKLEDNVRRVLKRTHILFAAFGSLARPAADELADLGVRKFTAVDPKSYVERSVLSQCAPDEVGRPKVLVGAERLGRHGLHVRAYHRDLEEVPDGVIDPETIVVATADCRRGDILANRKAARMRARILMTHIEPQLGTIAIRAYDDRFGVDLCAECQFSDRHYENQHHPRSCDGPAEGRRTNSERWFSETAASACVLAVCGLAADGASAGRWIGREWQYTIGDPAPICSTLSPNRKCRWNHHDDWPNVQRVFSDPSDVRLADLLGSRRPGRHSTDTIHFCRPVALRGFCGECGRLTEIVRWLAHSDADAAIDRCRHCTGPVYAVPFWTSHRVTAIQLAPVWDRPLNQWGVEPFAVMTVEGRNPVRSFVVGEDPPQWRQ